MSSAQESVLHYPLGDALPERGASLEVAPGVRWVRMGLPFALDHINLWLLRDRGPAGEGWTVVDCGIANGATREHWQQVFDTQLQGLPVLRVLVTHMHPDHIGLAHWLTERWNCRLWISATDWHAARLASQDTPGQGGDRSADFFARNGLTDEGVLKRVRERRNYYATLVPEVPLTYRRLLNGQALEIGGRAWRCMAGYGHAPEHIALHCPALDLLISGDMVLPRISSNVSVWESEPEADPLPMYLDSLRRLRTLPATTLVLPSHGKPFTGLYERIDQLLAHHDERFADVLAACREAPRSAAELLSVIFRRPLDLHQTTFAMGEAIAHVHALEGRGELLRLEGDDGVLRYRTVER